MVGSLVVLWGIVVLCGFFLVVFACMVVLLIVVVIVCGFSVVLDVCIVVVKSIVKLVIGLLMVVVVGDGSVVVFLVDAVVVSVVGVELVEIPKGEFVNSINTSIRIQHKFYDRDEFFPKKALVFTCLQYKSFQNTVGKAEVAQYGQFLLSHSVFYPLRKLSAILIKF